jgi:hypothetical protein
MKKELNYFYIGNSYGGNQDWFLVLLLSHNDIEFKPLLWHWFMIVGYEEREAELYVKVVTYSHWRYYSFKKMWNSGFRNNGGMIIYQ